jgi:hypothetical protein
MLRLGMFVTATFYGMKKEVHATVPASAVLHLHDRDWVYTPAGNGRYQRVEVAGGAMLLGAHMAGSLHRYALHRTLLAVAFGYLIWTFEQQFMLQSFFFLRLELLLGSRKAVWAAAGLFAVAHLPNPVLVPATLVAGLVFCELFCRYRNIYTLAIAQAILGMCLAAAVPESLHHHMRVGIGYLSWIAH